MGACLQANPPLLERTCPRTPSLASKLQQEPRFGGVFFGSDTAAWQALSPHQANSHCMPRNDPDLDRRFLGCPPEIYTMLRQLLIHFDTRIIFSSLLKCQKFDAKRSMIASQVFDTCVARLATPRHPGAGLAHRDRGAARLSVERGECG